VDRAPGGGLAGGFLVFMEKSHTREITTLRRINRGGYLSWRKESGSYINNLEVLIIGTLRLFVIYLGGIDSTGFNFGLTYPETGYNIPWLGPLPAPSHQ